MSEMKKIREKALENVTGGANRTVRNDTVGYAYIRSGPGKGYVVIDKVYNGDEVRTTGRVEYADGYDWYKLEGGGWIAGSLIGY